jgi:hypothetical protein
MPDAACSLKTGLWEITRTSEISAPPVSLSPQQLEGLDPAARARVAAVLQRQAAERAARGGAPQVNSHTKRECVTPESLARRQMSMNDNDRGERGESCPPVVKSRTASTIVLVTDCVIDGHPIHSDMTFEVKSPGEIAWQMSSSVNMGAQSGKTRATATGRWIGPACGDAKPARW